MLRITSGHETLLHSEKVSIHKGLNYKTIIINNFSAPAIPKPELQAEVKIPATVKPLPDSVKNITLYFKQSDHQLLPKSKEKLDQLALWLRETPTRKIRIAGHSDNVGDPQRNEVLSEYRARVTYNYLFQLGISHDKMLCTWLGGNKPVEKNDSEENKSKNRRVEITLVPEK